MNLKFSDTTAALLKAQLAYEQLAWTTGNELDLASIKKLKGCRNQLVEACLRLIANLDSFNSNEERKEYSTTTTQQLTANLKKYIHSSEKHPRLKKFLNFIPDHTSGVVVFTLIVSSVIAIFAYLPLAVIPIVIIPWIAMDLSFNNREAAKNLQEILYNVADELRTVETADNILKIKVQPAREPIEIQTPSSTTSPISIPRPSTSKNYSARFYGSIKHNPISQDESQDNQSTSSLSSN